MDFTLTTVCSSISKVFNNVCDVPIVEKYTNYFILFLMNFDVNVKRNVK